MAFVFVAAVSIPVVITAVTVATAGPLWQGRYGLPFHIGVILLAGCRPRPEAATPPVGGPVDGCRVGSAWCWAR